jgi:hypothetical protein
MKFKPQFYQIGKKKKKKARFTPVIIDTWEGEIGRTDI